jgi:hypothetical protein
MKDLPAKLEVALAREATVRANAVLAAAGYNFGLPVRWLASLLPILGASAVKRQSFEAARARPLARQSTPAATNSATWAPAEVAGPPSGATPIRMSPTAVCAPLNDRRVSL